MNIPETVGAAIDIGLRALKSRSETPRLDVEILLSEILHRPRSWILAHPEARLSAHQGGALVDKLSRYQSGTALPYILGWWEFYGRRFKVNPDVLIPRPETELLIEAALDFLLTNPECRLIADVGTGSGCIAVTLAAETPDLFVIATDISANSLEIAHTNAQDHHVVGQLQFIQADLLTPLAGPFDLICANLPYIPSKTLPQLNVAKREPTLALDGGPDGLEYIIRLLRLLPTRLGSNGQTLLEIGAEQGKAVLTAARDILPSSNIEVRKDIAGHDRLLVIDKL